MKSILPNLEKFQQNHFAKIILSNKYVTKFQERNFSKLIIRQNFAKYENCFAKFLENLAKLSRKIWQN